MTAFLDVTAKRRGGAAVRGLAVLSLTAMLAGCVTQEASNNDLYPTDFRERHPITLKEGTQTVEIFVSRNRGGLTPSQRADVLSFAQSWRHEATGGIVIDVPHGGPTDRAAADSMREVHSILAASGVPGNAVFMRSYRPADGSLASIKINYSKLMAQAGPCGMWPHDLGPSTDPAYAENRPFWNLGCASQRNLAAMVDNPADLVQPRGETPAYAARRSVALDKYRKGDNPSGTYSNDGTSGYDGGKISDLGK
jgi:pilus assembly protein CpaD